MIAGADMGDDFDDFLASWGHQEVDLKGDPVSVDSLPGSKQRQNHQIMEPARHRLSLSDQTLGRFDVSIEQMIGYDGMKPEADSLRSFGDVDQHAIGNRLLSGIGVNDVPAVISPHFQHHPAFGQAIGQASHGNCQ